VLPEPVRQARVSGNETVGPIAIRASESYTHPLHEISVQLVPRFVRRRLAVKQGRKRDRHGFAAMDFDSDEFPIISSRWCKNATCSMQRIVGTDSVARQGGMGRARCDL